ncbi:MAG: NAD-dependent epimerase/dehydratase family protein [Planctomycetales bacterium]
MKIFVTGGAGFLGRRVVKRLLDDGHDLRCLVRPSSAVDELQAFVSEGTQSRLELVQGTVGKLEGAAIAGCEAVCHVAAGMKGCTAALFSDNVTATRRLVKASQDAQVKRLVLISSMGVYGTSGLRRGEVLDERCPLDDQPHLRDAYSYSKVMQERVAWEAHEAGVVPLVVVRPGNIYGPGRDPMSARVGLLQGKLLLRLGGRQLLPYVQVDACAAGIALALTAPGVEGEAFNLLDEELLSGRTFLKHYRRLRRRDLWVVPIPQFAINPLARCNVWYNRWSRGQLPAVLTPYKCAAMWKSLRYSVDKAKQKLGWSPWGRTLDGMLPVMQS